MEVEYLLVLGGVGAVFALILLIWGIAVCCCQNNHKSCTCCTCRCSQGKYGTIDTALQRVVYPGAVPHLQQHLVNAHPKFWQSLSPAPLHEEIKPTVSNSPDSSAGKPLAPATFEFSLSATETSTVNLTAIKLRNIRCTAPKVFLRIKVLVPRVCCQVTEVSETQRDTDKGLERTDKGADTMLKGEATRGLHDSGFGIDVPPSDVSSTSPQSLPMLSPPRDHHLSTSSADSISSESPSRTQTATHQQSTEYLAEEGLQCPLCKKPFILVSSAQFESKSTSFRSEIMLGDTYTFVSESGGPFWIEASVIDKEDPDCMLFKGRTADLYRQNHSLKTLEMEASKKDSKGSVLISLKYLPLTQKMTMTLVESKDIKAMDIELALDIYMKTCLLSRGSTAIRARSHGPLPSPIHDKIALWSDHGISFDVPAHQLSKVTIIAELIQKAIQDDSMSLTPSESSLVSIMKTKSKMPEITIDNVERGEDVLEQQESELPKKNICRRRLGRCSIGSDAETQEGRDQWNAALDSSRTEVLYWHSLY